MSLVQVLGLGCQDGNPGSRCSLLLSSMPLAEPTCCLLWLFLVGMNGALKHAPTASGPWWLQVRRAMMAQGASMAVPCNTVLLAQSTLSALYCTRLASRYLHQPNCLKIRQIHGCVASVWPLCALGCPPLACRCSPISCPFLLCIVNCHLCD